MWSETTYKTFDKHIGITRKYMKNHLDQLKTKLDKIVEKMTDEQISVKQAKSRTLGSHVLPWRQTGL